MIYLDHAASTPLHPAVLSSISELNTDLGNPSSVHSLGRNARNCVDLARLQICETIGVKSEEVIFTSGGTEAMFLGVVGSWLALNEVNKKKHILVSPLSHSCVWSALDFLVNHHQVVVRFLPIKDSGHLDTEKIDEALLSTASIVIAEQGNSEIGILQPIATLGKKIQRFKVDSQNDELTFIVDAAASVVCHMINFDYLKCDIFIISGEKFGAFAGTGACFKKSTHKMIPIIAGSQELGYRAGTENVMGIKSFGVALKANYATLEEQKMNFESYHQQCRKYFTERHPDISIVTSSIDYLSHVFHFLLPEKFKTSELFLVQCDLAGICVSAGPACNSGSVDGSRVLKALGSSDAESKRGIRLSFGNSTTSQDLKKAFTVFDDLLS